MELTPIGMERQATKYARYVLDDYAETREHPWVRIEWKKEKKNEWQSRTFFEKNAVYSAFLIEGGEEYEANGDELVWNVWKCSCPFIWRMGYRTADIGSFYSVLDNLPGTGSKE